MQFKARHEARLLALLTTLATALALVALPAAAEDAVETATERVEAAQPDDVTAARVEGRNRFETAANIATLTFDSAETAVVVTGQNYPDALAGSFAAGTVDGPLLLVTRDGVPAATWETLAELDVSDVVMLGGSAAISDAVEVEMTAQGYTVERVAGVNRFQTASATALRFGAEAGIGTLDGDLTAILASGQAFPDALSAGPLSAAAGLPLFLTPADSTEVSVNRALQELGIQRILVMGGTGAVSSDVVTYYQEQGYTVERFGGRNRMETATIVAQNAIERFEGFSPQGILLARGDDYPDALTASVHGGTIGAPVLLTATPEVLSPATEGWLRDTCPNIAFVRALGGVGAVSVDVLSAAVAAAGECRDGDPGGSFCENVQDGYIVTYPGDWVTNIRSLGTVPVCSLFDPDPDQIRTEDMEVPADIGVFLRVEDVDFDEASTVDPRFETELSRTETTVDDRTAVRLETEATGAGLHPEGTLQTRWVVDLDDTTFIGVSFDIGEPAYSEKQAVLDEMMDAIDFDD